MFIPNNWYQNPDGSYDVHGNITLSKCYVSGNRIWELIKKIRYINWAGVSGSIYSYEQWIPKSSRIEHINMTPKQEYELRALQMTWV